MTAFARSLRTLLSRFAQADHDRLRLLTVPPLPPGSPLSVPFFRRRIADLTFLDADFPYFAMCYSNVAEFMLSTQHNE